MTPSVFTVRKNHIQQIGLGLFGIAVFGIIAFVVGVALGKSSVVTAGDIDVPDHVTPAPVFMITYGLVRPWPGCFAA